MTIDELLKETEFRLTKDNCHKNADEYNLELKKNNTIALLKDIEKEITDMTNLGYYKNAVKFYGIIDEDLIIKTLIHQGFKAEIRKDGDVDYFSISWE